MILNDKTFFLWLLAASFSMMLLCIIFVSFLRNWTFFLVNRIILMSGTCICLILPIISPNMVGNLLVTEGKARSQGVNILAFQDIPLGHQMPGAGATSLLESFEWFGLIVVVYWLGVAVMAVRSFTAFNQLRLIKKEAKFMTKDHLSTVWSQNKLPTFSFGRDIFLNVHTLTLPVDQIMAVRRHEEAHVQQRHTVDNLFFELIAVIFWFNPFAGMLSRCLREVHEFLADQWACSTVQPAEYQQLLIRLASRANANHVTHTFSTSQLFRRIVMLNKPKTKVMESFKLLLLVPALAVAMLLSACLDENRSNPSDRQGIIMPPASAPVISKITWTGNNMHSEDELNELLGLKAGDRYDPILFEQMIDRGAGKPCITNLYMNDGYLFFRTEAEEKLVGDQVELTVNVQEGERVWINNVILKTKNGMNLNLDEFRELIDFKTGQLFNRALLFSSREKLVKSDLASSHSVDINPLPLAMENGSHKKLVDFEFVVKAP